MQVRTAYLKQSTGNNLEYREGGRTRIYPRRRFGPDVWGARNADISSSYLTLRYVPNAGTKAMLELVLLQGGMILLLKRIVLRTPAHTCAPSYRAMTLESLLPA